MWQRRVTTLMRKYFMWLWSDVMMLFHIYYFVSRELTHTPPLHALHSLFSALVPLSSPHPLPQTHIAWHIQYIRLCMLCSDSPASLHAKICGVRLWPPCTSAPWASHCVFCLLDCLSAILCTFAMLCSH